MALGSGCGISGCLEPGPLAVLASFFLFFLSLGNISSFVILYVYLQDEFKASAIETGWVGSAAWAVMNFMAPFPSALYVRFGCQRVVFVGVLLAFVGLLATSFASQLWMTYITYGLVFAAGSNFMLTATINLVTSYYPGDNNIRATSLASAGQPVGLLIINVSLERACFYLGWRNGLRIVSGLTLAMGMFCTALSRQPQITRTTDSQNVDCKPSTSTHETGGRCSTAECGATPVALGSRSPGEPQQITMVKMGMLSKKYYRPVPTDNGNGFITESSAQGFSENTTSHLSQSSTELDRETNCHHFGAKTRMELRLTSSLSNLKANSSQVSQRSETHTECEETIGDVGESLNLQPLVQSDSATIIPNPAVATFFVRYVTLLRLPVHWLFFGGIIGSSLASLFNVIHFVSFAATVDISEPTASWLLIIMSGMEIAARALIFICGNRVPISRTIIFAVVCVMGALATYGLVVLPAFAMVNLYVIILGFVRGIMYAIGYGATVDTFGVDCAVESYTSLLVSYGIAGALVSTIGISKDLTGKFTISLHIIAVLFLLSAILFICAHVWRKRTPLIGRREQVQRDANAHVCDDEKHVGHQQNGVVAANGERMSEVIATSQHS